MVNITLKDGSKMQVEKGATVLEVAKKISEGLARVATCGEVNGKIKDLRYELKEDCNLTIHTFSNDDLEGKKAYWHTTSHIMAQAVKRLFPDVKFAIGPSIDDGFYYDFDVEKPFTDEDKAKIEEEMKKIIKEDIEIERFTLPKKEALELMKDQPYKQELIEELPEGEEISFYKQGDFTDLCAGPHLTSTGKVKAVKILTSSGAYWRGSEKNKMLQRIYAISFPKASELQEYLDLLEEAKKRDHKKLGKELDLFMISPEGPGFPFFLPKGMILRNVLEDFWRKIHIENGYVEIKTPMILNEELWHRSGHWDHYKDNMYTTKIDDVDFGIKPMNCPGGMIVYKRDMHSYRDLPIRAGELGLVHRHEKSGELNGLFRVRCFTQDDAHIFCLPEQMETEIAGVIKLVDKVYSLFGFPYSVELSTRPEDSMGSDELWNMAESTLKKVLEDLKIPYELNEGDGAFYGPKIDFHIKDCLGRSWQCGTVQLDFQMPERFDLTYIGEDGEKHRPVMLHRVIFGSIERFIGILIEHFAGAFPTWLAPVQVKILPISEKHLEYAKKIYDELFEKGVRVEIDASNEKVGYKIRKTQMEKVPYMLVVGDKEQETNTVAVRSRELGDEGTKQIEEFIKKIQEEINKRK